MAYKDYEAVIGLEIHTQLKTESKMFCRCSTRFGKGDNANTCPICMGMPGTLPAPNEKALEYSAKTGLALNCKISTASVFARKNYFYPDMPKSYQISQYEKPLCSNGWVEFYIGDEKRRINIERAHMEEDAGKSTHHGDYSLINLNRASVPLLEIVSAPELKSPEEAAEYARTMQKIVRCLDVCDGNLEEGSMRCDCNVSIRKKGDTKLGTKVEIKNINSFRFVEKALQYEIERQIDCVESGQKIVQETRLYDIDKNKTYTMRTKENAEDYRYFPDPDLIAAKIEVSEIESWRQQLPELPLSRLERFESEYGLSRKDSALLTAEKEMADFFEQTAERSKNAKAASNWILGEVLRVLNEDKIELGASKLTPELLAQLIALVDGGKISMKIAKTVFNDVWASGEDPEKIVEAKGLTQITDSSAIEKIVDEVIQANPNQVQQYKEGKDKVFGFFVGQVMKLTKGQASPDLVNKLLKEKLK